MSVIPLNVECCAVNGCKSHIWSDDHYIKAKGQKRVFFTRCCEAPTCSDCYIRRNRAHFICKFCKQKTYITGKRKTAIVWWDGLYQARRSYMETSKILNRISPSFYDRFFGHLPIRGNWRNLGLLPTLIRENHDSIWRMFMFFASRRNLRFNPTSLPTSFNELVTMANYVEMNPPLKYPPTNLNVQFFARMLVQYCHFGIFETLISRMALPMVPMPDMSRNNRLKLQKNLMKMMWKKILKVIASKVSWNLCY